MDDVLTVLQRGRLRGSMATAEHVQEKHLLAVRFRPAAERNGGCPLRMPHEHRTREIVADLIPQPPAVLARHATNTGEIQLQHRLRDDGSDVFEIISDGVFLMSSQFHLGEQVLAQYALFDIEQHLPADRRVLIGGLGMGFTLQETLEHAVTKVDVVEISNHVVNWNRRFFTPLNKNALSDPRAHLIHQDLYCVLNQAKPATYAAIILDVDNGPSWLAHAQNARLYTDEALATWSALLVPDGVLAVWSAQMEPAFMERMKRHFRDVEEATVLLPDPKGRTRNDYVYRGIR